MSYYKFRLFSLFFLPLGLPLAITSLVSFDAFIICVIVVSMIASAIFLMFGIIWFGSGGDRIIEKHVKNFLNEAKELDKKQTIKKNEPTTHNNGELSVVDTEGNISLTE